MQTKYSTKKPRAAAYRDPDPEPPDIGAVLMDIMMPAMDGFEVIR